MRTLTTKGDKVNEKLQNNIMTNRNSNLPIIAEEMIIENNADKLLKHNCKQMIF